jgi:hypothetical protein
MNSSFGWLCPQPWLMVSLMYPLRAAPDGMPLYAGAGHRLTLEFVFIDARKAFVGL